MYLKTISLILAMAAVLLGEPALSQQPIILDAAHVKPLMQMKLERAKAILEGLAIEDYEKIASNARALKLLSLESGWNVYQTDQYRMQSRDFRQSIDLITEAAGNKEINRAAMGYMALTIRCVECHTYMRKNKLELMRFQPDP